MMTPWATDPSSGPSAQGTLRAHRFGLILAGVIIALGFLCYYSSLDGGFVYDDHFLVENNYYIRSLSPSNILRVLTQPINDTYRPLRVLSYALDYRLWGLDPGGFRLANLWLHLLNGILVYLLVSGLLKARWPAAFAALLFTVHPVQTESVAWISVRKDLLATAFALGSLLLYLRGRGEERTEDGLSVPSWRARAILLQVVSCGLFAAAVLSKEGTIALLAVIFVYEFLLRSDDLSHRVLNSIVPTLPYLGVGIVFLAVYFWIGHGHGALPSYHEGGRWATAVLMTKGFAYYLLLLFFPVHLCADYNTFGAGGVDAWFMLSAAALVGVAALTWALYRRMPLAAFGVVWFFVCLAPVSNVIPIAARISERYLYLPLVGFCIAVAVVMSAIPRRRMAAPSVLLCALLALLCALTAQRAADWTSDRALWESALRSYPDSPRVNYSLGYLFHKRLGGSPPEERRSPEAAPVLRRADFHFRRAIEADPKYAKAVCGLAHVEMDRGDGPAGLRLLERAVACQPNDPRIRQDFASVLAKMGMTGAAVKQYIATAKLAPNDPEVLRDLGRVSLADGHAESALLVFNRVREVCPTMPAIYSDIGNAELALGRFAEAAVALERALREAPDDARIAHNLSYAYQQLGQGEKAKALQQALPRARPRQ